MLAYAAPSVSEADLILRHPSLLPNLLFVYGSSSLRIYLRFPLGLPVPGAGNFVGTGGLGYWLFERRLRTADIGALICGMGFDRALVIQVLEAVKLADLQSLASNPNITCSPEQAQDARGKGPLAAEVLEKLWDIAGFRAVVQAQRDETLSRAAVAGFGRHLALGAGRPDLAGGAAADVQSVVSTILSGDDHGACRTATMASLSGGRRDHDRSQSRFSAASTVRGSSPDEEATEVDFAGPDDGRTAGSSPSEVFFQRSRGLDGRRHPKNRLRPKTNREAVQRYFDVEKHRTCDAASTRLQSVVGRSPTPSVSAMSLVSEYPPPPSLRRGVSFNDRPTVFKAESVASFVSSSTVHSRMDWVSEAHLQQLEMTAQYSRLAREHAQALESRDSLLKHMAQQEMAHQTQERATLERHAKEVEEVRLQAAAGMRALDEQIEKLKLEHAADAEALQEMVEMRELDADLTLDQQKRAEAAMQNLVKVRPSLFLFVRDEGVDRDALQVLGQATDLLQCSLCYERYGTRSHNTSKRPLHLTCGHTYCYSCLHGYWSSLESEGDPQPIKCPVRCANLDPRYKAVSESILINQINEMFDNLPCTSWLLTRACRRIR